MLSFCFKRRVIFFCSTHRLSFLLFLSGYGNPYLQDASIKGLDRSSRYVRTAIQIGEEHRNLNASFSVLLWLYLLHVAAVTLHGRFGQLIHHGCLTGRPQTLLSSDRVSSSFVGPGHLASQSLGRGCSMLNQIPHYPEPSAFESSSFGWQKLNPPKETQNHRVLVWVLQEVDSETRI